eukprot:jgi/Psemu1/308253/fgenesh1_kg.392_\
MVPLTDRDAAPMALGLPKVRPVSKAMMPSPVHTGYSPYKIQVAPKLIQNHACITKLKGDPKKNQMRIFVRNIMRFHLS